MAQARAKPQEKTALTHDTCVLGSLLGPRPTPPRAPLCDKPVRDEPGPVFNKLHPQSIEHPTGRKFKTEEPTPAQEVRCSDEKAIARLLLIQMAIPKRSTSTNTAGRHRRTLPIRLSDFGQRYGSEYRTGQVVHVLGFVGPLSL